MSNKKIYEKRNLTGKGKYIGKYIGKAVEQPLKKLWSMKFKDKSSKRAVIINYGIHRTKRYWMGLQKQNKFI